MSPTIRTIDTSDVYADGNLRRRLANLTIRTKWQDSWMRTMLARKVEGKVVLAQEGDTIIGWALMIPRSGRGQISVYVRNASRNRGVGVRLAKRAKLLAKRRKVRPVCQPWTPQGTAMFKKAGVAKSYLSWWA